MPLNHTSHRYSLFFQKNSQENLKDTSFTHYWQQQCDQICWRLCADWVLAKSSIHHKLKNRTKAHENIYKLIWKVFSKKTFQNGFQTFFFYFKYQLTSLSMYPPFPEGSVQVTPTVSTAKPDHDFQMFLTCFHHLLVKQNLTDVFKTILDISF